MADVEFDDFDDGFDAPLAYAGSGRTGRLINIAGAVCSIGLVLGLAVWGYKLAVRDVTGVPVMRAMAGPMRIAPADPGGDQASNQGLSVNAIASIGTAAPLPDEVVLAPKPVALAADDAAGLATAVGGGAGTALTVSTDRTVVAAEPTPAPLADTLTADAVPLDDGDATAVEMTGGSLADAIDAAVADATQTSDPGNGLPRSLRPHPRPGSEATSAGAVSNVQTVSAQAPGEIDPATLAVGTRLAQLGAFDDADAAQAKWVALQAQFGDLMVSRSMVIQTAQSGGRTFYRLRAHGFDSEEDARRFCAALLAESADCIPVAQR